MKVRRLHSWNVPPRDAVQLQLKLRDELENRPLPSHPRFVAGGDIAYSPKSNRMFAAVAVLELPSLTTVEEVSVIRPVEYPYVPGLLSFREAPALVEAFAKLRHHPEVILVDGQGQAHPRGFGIAAHLGLLLDTPTVGCAKSRLVGTHKEPGPNRGDWTPLEYKGHVVGAVLRTRQGVCPLYISAGHKSDLAGAIALVLRCCAVYRTPEPTRRTHNIVSRLRAEHDGGRDA